MSKKSKVVLCIVAFLVLILAVAFQDQLTPDRNRIDLHRVRSVQLPPMYYHGDNNISIQDIVIFDLSGTNSRFTSTTIEWNFEGDLNGTIPRVDFTTLTPGKSLISSISVSDSAIEFVPITDQGRGTAAITISVGDESRTVFVKIYDLSLRLIALEFDDGPSVYTNQIVRALNNAGVSASFYMTGSNFHDVEHKFVGVEVYPEAAILAFISGHHIGNHTYSHPWGQPHSGGFSEEFPEGQYKPWWQYTEEEVTWQVNSADEAIYEVLGIIPTYYAPIYYYEGHNDYIIMAGKTISFRNFAVDIGDWELETTEEDIVNRVLSTPGASTVVLHDVYQKTAEAIEIIVNSPQAQEIQFVTGYEMDMILGR